MPGVTLFYKVMSVAPIFFLLKQAQTGCCNLRCMVAIVWPSVDVDSISPLKIERRHWKFETKRKEAHTSGWLLESYDGCTGSLGTLAQWQWLGSLVACCFISVSYYLSLPGSFAKVYRDFVQEDHRGSSSNTMHNMQIGKPTLVTQLNLPHRRNTIPTLWDRRHWHSYHTNS